MDQALVETAFYVLSAYTGAGGSGFASPQGAGAYRPCRHRGEAAVPRVDFSRTDRLLAGHVGEMAKDGSEMDA